MFSDNIKIIQDSFLKYKGTGMYMALFFLAILYLFLTEKNKSQKMFMVYFSCLIMVVILNPLFNKCVDSLLNKNVYWRNFWLLPMGITIAYAGVSVIKGVSNKNQKMITFLLILLIIVSSGKCIYTAENYQKIGNAFKLPEEYIEVINKISEMNLEHKKVLTTIEMIPYIRQIDAKIELAFERRPFGDYKDYEIIDYYNTGSTHSITNLCQQQNINIIVYDKAIPLQEPLINYGFKLTAQTEHYEIYVME